MIKLLKLLLCKSGSYRDVIVCKLFVIKIDKFYDGANNRAELLNYRRVQRDVPQYLGWFAKPYLSLFNDRILVSEYIPKVGVCTVNQLQEFYNLSIVPDCHDRNLGIKKNKIVCVDYQHITIPHVKKILSLS